MFSKRFQQSIRLERMLSGALGVLAGLMLSIFSDWIIQGQKISLIWILAGVLLTLSVVLFIIRLRHPFTDIDVAIKSPKIIRSDEQRKDYARRGFIGFTPLFKPARDSSAINLSSEDRKTAIENGDFDKLDIEHSNLLPTIQAITQHAGKLKYCWLLTTTSKNPEESTHSTASLLAKYLRTQKGLTRCDFQISKIYDIQMGDDALVLSNTFDRIKSVFAQAARMGLSPQDVIVDFSTGTRSMMLGMILASLTGDRDIQFMGTHYGEDGLPKPNELYPIIFSFEPLPPSD